MSYSSQYGLNFTRTPENLILPFWGNPNGPTWIRRMLPNGGNKNQGNVGINGKKWWANRLSSISQGVRNLNIVASFTGTSGKKYHLVKHTSPEKTKPQVINEITIKEKFTYSSDFYESISLDINETIDGISYQDIIDTVVPLKCDFESNIVLFVDPNDNTKHKNVSVSNSVYTVSPSQQIIIDETETDAQKCIYYFTVEIFDIL